MDDGAAAAALTQAAKDKLRQTVMKIEKLEEEKKEVAGQIKDVYQEAKSMGYDDADFHRVYDRAIERRDNLKSMLKMVGSMELEQDLEKAPFKAD